MKTKFDEYLDFPCPFTFKVMGLKRDSLAQEVIQAVNKLVPGTYSTTSRDSANGTYSSITISVLVSSKEDIENLYSHLMTIEGVKHVL